MKGAPAVSSYFLSKISGKIIGKTAGRYAILVQKQYPMPVGFMQQNLCVGGTGTEKKRDRNKTMIFDTHAHYDDEAFDEDREQLLATFKENGIGAVTNVAASISSCKTTLELARNHDFMYAALGVHPSESAELSDEGLKEESPEEIVLKKEDVDTDGMNYHRDQARREDPTGWKSCFW